MTETDFDVRPFSAEMAEDIRDHKWFFWVVGILSTLFGAAAIIMPNVATLAAPIVIGAVLAAQGVIACIAAFQARKTSRIAMGVALGLLSLAAGVVLLVYPLSGIVVLTLILTGFLLGGGALKLYYAWKMHDSAGWGWMAVAGLLSIALGALIWSGLPGTAFWILGLLVGIDLVFYGISMIATVMAARKLAKEWSNEDSFASQTS